MRFEIEENSGDVTVRLPYAFSLAQTLDCGQCFRWRAVEGGENAYAGIAEDKPLAAEQPDERTVVFRGVGLAEFEGFWKNYFDFGRDYEPIKDILARDAVLARAIEFCGGIRVLRQPRWETLCSYIISQNNNIPRIKSLIQKMCAAFGEPIRRGAPDGGAEYSFPGPEVLAEVSTPDFAKLGFGYRAPYLAAAARAVASGEVNLGAVAKMPIGEARRELRKLLGVGPKVAECSLLYGFGMDAAFPVDTWIRTVMSEFYPDGLPEFVKPYAGIAQIYLFHYIRSRAAG